MQQQQNDLDRGRLDLGRFDLGQQRAGGGLGPVRMGVVTEAVGGDTQFVGNLYDPYGAQYESGQPGHAVTVVCELDHVALAAAGMEFAAVWRRTRWWCVGLYLVEESSEFASSASFSSDLVSSELASSDAGLSSERLSSADYSSDEGVSSGMLSTGDYSSEAWSSDEEISSGMLSTGDLSSQEWSSDEGVSSGMLSTGDYSSDEGISSGMLSTGDYSSAAWSSDEEYSSGYLSSGDFSSETASSGQEPSSQQGWSSGLMSSHDYSSDTPSSETLSSDTPSSEFPSSAFPSSEQSSGFDSSLASSEQPSSYGPSSQDYSSADWYSCGLYPDTLTVRVAGSGCVDGVYTLTNLMSPNNCTYSYINGSLSVTVKLDRSAGRLAVYWDCGSAERQWVYEGAVRHGGWYGVPRDPDFAATGCGCTSGSVMVGVG